MTEEKTVIRGSRCFSKSDFKTTGEYELLLFLHEKETHNHINIRYKGNNTTEHDYYENCYEHFLRGDTPRDIQLTIKGCIKDDKMEYEGIGLIKLI